MAEPLPAMIDSLLSDAWKGEGIEPNPIVDDSAFLRRVTLDLAGRVPTLAEMDAFDQRPDRNDCIDRLLERMEFAESWASTWTSVLNGYSEAFKTDREALRLWLRDQLERETSYDSIATQLIAATGPSTRDGAVNFLARYPKEEAVRVSRMFLGVRIDCARCHDHPFDRWKKKDFASMDRFFDATRRRGDGNPELIDEVRRTSQRPVFLTGAKPLTSRWRQELALFVTNTNAFRKTFSNRVWYQLMGRGIVDPPDDFSQDNPPVIPPLLDYLADQAEHSGWNLKNLIRGICQSQAYQRSSRSQGDSAQRRTFFACATVKPMTPEQWFQSLKTIFGEEAFPIARRDFIEEMVTADLGTDYSQTWRYRETLKQRMSQLTLEAKPPARSHENLFRRILNRMPTDHERRLSREASPEDLAFALTNGNEFYFNH